jgi:hypothetical protein
MTQVATQLYQKRCYVDSAIDAAASKQIEAACT